MKEVRYGLEKSSQSKPPVLQYVPGSGHWRLWLAYNATLTKGTYLALHPQGEVERVTINPDETLSLQRL